MSGHSKWSSIKHKKAAQDARRGKLFTKLIREVTVAARHGGGDPEANPRLRLAINQARNNNMPMDTINRAIAKGSGTADGEDYEEVIYEGYGPNNVAVVIEALTDNRNRTIASIRHTFGKHNGNLGATNSVQYMFERKGTLTVPKEGLDEDALTEYVLEGGGEDLEDQEDSFLVICPLEAFESLRSLLEEKGVTIGSAELQRLPQARVTLSSKEDAEKVLTFLEALEEDDDVQKVFSNLDIDEAILAELT
jgi:YebC/PmpR family DNA-binding regulatory protein